MAVSLKTARPYWWDDYWRQGQAPTLLRHPSKLQDHCSLFQAVVFAIGNAAELVSNISSVNSRANIYVDSQSAIKAITSVRISPKRGSGSKTGIESVARNKRLNFHRVLGHKGFEGSEIVKSGVRLRVGNVTGNGKPIVYTTIQTDREGTVGKW